MLKFLVFFFVVIGCAEEKILVLTVPKSGTHMLIKAMRLITGCQTRWVGLQAKRFDVNTDLRLREITGAHLFPLFDSIRTNYLDRYKVVLLIRDPRDVMLSFAGHLQRAMFWTSCPMFDYDRFIALPFEEQLYETLLFPQEYLSPSICFPYVRLWMNEPSVFVCRFEDLVGPRGGGSEEKQLTCLAELARHVGYPKSDEEIRIIAGALFGNTWTFDVGRIGRWKEKYNPENLSLFMNLFGQYISDWGYL